MGEQASAVRKTSQSIRECNLFRSKRETINKYGPTRGRETRRQTTWERAVQSRTGAKLNDAINKL
jgi:hypothetical protein